MPMSSVWTTRLYFLYIPIVECPRLYVHLLQKRIVLFCSFLSPVLPLHCLAITTGLPLQLLRLGVITSLLLQLCDALTAFVTCSLA